jgi:hypothetical protein
MLGKACAVYLTEHSAMKGILRFGDLFLMEYRLFAHFYHHGQAIWRSGVAREV